MIKSGKSGKAPSEKLGNLGKKLKRGGHTTPVLPSWKLQQLPARDSIIKEDQFSPFPFPFPSASARKLASIHWELHLYNLPLSKMQHGISGPPPRHRRHNRHNHHLLKDDELYLPDPSPSSPELGSASSLRRHIAASLMQHHRTIQRNHHHAIQPVSPASYGSSMEVTPYNPAVTPTSTDFKEGIGETSYSLKTSTELIKVLNRIWSLEEQHASNISLVRALKKELDQARAKIRELVLDQQADRHEIDELMKQISEAKLGRKSKEQDRVSAAIQSVRDELQDERKLRKRSETLHRKLARELYEVKMTLANSSKDLEKERKSRKLLEDLCDEFAWGIKNYEQEMHSLKYKSEKDLTNRGDYNDGLILHISESWLDERIQMKQEQSQFGYGEKKNSIMDKLSSEIETFLHAKRNVNYKGRDNSVPRGPTVRRNSLESIPLNVAASAPQDEGEEEASSVGSDSHCFELEKPVGFDFKPRGDEGEKNLIDSPTKPKHAEKKLASQERTKDRSPTSLQVKFEEQMAQAISGNRSKNRDEGIEEGKTGEENSSVYKKSEICEATEGGLERKNKTNETSTSNYVDSLIRSHHLLSDNGNMQHENGYVDSGGNSVWSHRASPVRQWTTRLPTEDLEIPESSSKLPPDLKENTLKTKLLAARTRGQRSRSRLKASKVSF